MLILRACLPCSSKLSVGGAAAVISVVVCRVGGEVPSVGTADNLPLCWAAWLLVSYSLLVVLCVFVCCVDLFVVCLVCCVKSVSYTHLTLPTILLV